MFISRVPLIVADMLLIYITWTKLSSKDALRGLGQSKRLSLSDILFRSGMFLHNDASGMLAAHFMPRIAHRNHILRVRPAA